jgi:7,8-dihydropterin-6-yl-methyl-4-(beta-D-ribofuranosyl)aminobenzene 5'-phosphate synthase
VREGLWLAAQVVGGVIAGGAALLALTTLLLWARYALGRALDRRRWRALYDAAEAIDVGAVDRLTVLPLVEWQISRPSLSGEAGVSYLVEADAARVLFDLGDGRRGEASALRRNLRALDLSPDELGASLTAVVISHAHREHVGGRGAAWRKRIGSDVALGEAPRYAPWREADRPRRIADGVWVTPALPGRTFVGGRVDEQALLIHVAGRGLVCIVGDGHPEPPALVDYAARLTGVTPYAYVGGLHALLADEAPLPWRWLLARRPPWRPFLPEEVGLLAVDLRQAGIQRLLASAHNSDDVSLAIIGTAFGESMNVLRVGERQEL